MAPEESKDQVQNVDDEDNGEADADEAYPEVIAEWSADKNHLTTQRMVRSQDTKPGSFATNPSNEKQ